MTRDSDSSAVFRNLSGIVTRIGIEKDPKMNHFQFTIPHFTNRLKEWGFMIPD